ncbi:unnamed protein product [Ectocarpus sp. 12 AP-2014]
MLRSANQLASSGCRVGRSLASRAQLGVSPPAFQPPVLAGRQAGLCRTHMNISRSSMTCTSAFHRAGHHHHIAAACGASVSMSRRGLPVGAGKSRLAGVGDLGLTMAATRGILTGPFSGPFSPGSTSSPKRPEALPSGEKPALINRYIEPPEDGLTRYPTFRSPQGVLRGLDYLGTTVFAISGTVTAGQVGMDLLGCIIVGTITATGGGTVRDVLLGNTPVFWMHETEYLWMCLATTVGIFFLWSYLAERGVRDDMALLNWVDAMGVGAFCCIGAQAGVRKGLSNVVCVACGMLTSTFGGVIRDVLCSRPPRILFSHCEIYASTAVLGSAVYIATKAAGLPPVVRIMSGFLSAVALRVLAFTTDIRLPTWTQPSMAAVGEEQLEEMEAESEAKKIHLGGD